MTREFDSAINGGMSLARRALIILSTLGLFILTFNLWYFTAKGVSNARRDLFNERVRVAKDVINGRVDEISNVLYGLRGFMGHGETTTLDWEGYLTASGFFNRFEGISTIGSAQRVKNKDLKNFVSKMMGNSDPRYKNFTVLPEGVRDEYYPVTIIKAIKPELAAVVGFDLLSEEQISEKIKAAIETNEVKLSELLIVSDVLPDVTEKDYIALLPIYKVLDSEDLTIEQRKEFVTGIVGILMTPSALIPYSDPSIKITVYDEGEIVYEGVGIEGRDGGEYSMSEDVDILGRKLTINFHSTEKFRLNTFEELVPYYALAGGIIIDLFWLMTIANVLTSKRRAVKLAVEATKDLRKFKLAVDSVSDHVIITDVEGNIVYTNHAAEVITGYSREEMLGHKPSLWGRQMSKEWYQKFWQTIKFEKKSFSGELRNMRKNGEIYEVELKASPILDNQGKVIYFVGVERDITKQKLVDRMKTEYISLTSHQMRTPLTAIRWFTDMLLGGEGGELTADQKRMLKSIQRSNQRMVELVTSLLNISRIETGVIKIVPELTDMKKLIKDTLELLPATLKTKKRKVVLDFQKGLPKANIDPKLISNVYMNLLTNAVKYSPVKSAITVRLESDGENFISSVSDRGMGIPKSEQGRMFEKFFRGTNASRVDTEGVGLGMYLIKLIVESSGGKVWYKSIEGEGTTVWFSLPLKRTPES